MKNLSISQTKLFGLKFFFNEIIDLFNKNKLPNKILFSGQQGVGKSTLAFHILNYILSLNEQNKYLVDSNTINTENKSYNLIKNGSHPNFYLIDLIDEKKNIEISQIRSMINYTNKSSFNNNKKIILINNVDNLNINSLNSLLKITEEPNENILFILIYNNSKKISKTLISRFLVFKIYLSFEETLMITNQIIEDDIFKILNKELINHYSTPGQYVNLINFGKKNKINLKENNLKNFLSILIDNKYYKKNNFVKLKIYNYIELYFLNLFNASENKLSFIYTYSNFIKKIDNVNRFNLDYESLFLEFKNEILNG